MKVFLVTGCMAAGCTTGGDMGGTPYPAFTTTTAPAFTTAMAFTTHMVTAATLCTQPEVHVPWISTQHSTYNCTTPAWHAPQLGQPFRSQLS
jgi:hypothetical protein